MVAGMNGAGWREERRMKKQTKEVSRKSKERTRRKKNKKKKITRKQKRKGKTRIEGKDSATDDFRKLV